jgi:hypothetical protein
MHPFHPHCKNPSNRIIMTEERGTNIIIPFGSSPSHGVPRCVFSVVPNYQSRSPASIVLLLFPRSFVVVIRPELVLIFRRCFFDLLARLIFCSTL